MNRVQLFALAVSCLLAACGGGGGGGTSDAAGGMEQRVPMAMAVETSGDIGYGACEGLVTLSLPGASVTVAESVSSGVWTLADGTVLSGLPAFCRVEGTASPVAGSRIGFEVWIPLGSRWNGKYMQVGMIAYGGSYEHRAMASMLQRGYATAATDGGHKGSTANASWALNAPQQIIDWGWRAHQQTAAHAKAIVQGYSGLPPSRSYFFGASTGGRDSLAMAQRHPEAFDGFIVDAPAIRWTRQAASWVWAEQALFTEPGSWIPHAKLPAIQAAAMAQCDALDGLADNIVGDPRRCRFDPSVLQCKLAEGNDCLTPQQVTALRKLYVGATHPSTGQRVYPGYEVAAATDVNFINYIIGRQPLVADSLLPILGNTFWANMVNDTGDAAYDFRRFDLDSDVALAESRLLAGGESLATAINAVNPDLSSARDRGAKILMVTGWEDPVVAARGVIDYYERVIAAQIAGNDKGRTALDRTQGFFRFFLAPGVSHFSGGTGPDGLGSPYGQPALRMDPQHDVIRAMEAWVEEGKAPERLVATQYVAGTPALGVQRTRPLCPYPQVARYAGDGSTNEAASFSCVDSARGAYLD